MTHNQKLDTLSAICAEIGPKRLCCLVAEVFSTNADRAEMWGNDKTADYWNRAAAATLNAYDQIPDHAQ